MSNQIMVWNETEQPRRTGGMSWRLLLAILLVPALQASAAEPAAKAERLSAEQVVERHVQARGGLDAWRAVRAISFSGKMDAGRGDSVERSMRVAKGPGAVTRKARRESATSERQAEGEKQVQLPFTLARQIPNLSRLEIEFAGKIAVQVFDGIQGWKLRPFLNRNDVEPLTADEVKLVADDSDLDDPLMDAAAKGRTVTLEGVEKVEGNEAYKLKVRGAGTERRVWVDTRSFLDVKVEGAPRRMDGKMHAVWTIQRDFRSVQGLKIPFVRETFVDGFPQGHSIVIEKVAVNPALDAATFSKPRA